MCCMYTVYSGMQEWVIQIPSIPILVSVLFPSLHPKYFRIKFLLLVIYTRAMSFIKRMLTTYLVRDQSRSQHSYFTVGLVLVIT